MTKQKGGKNKISGFIPAPFLMHGHDGAKNPQQQAYLVGKKHSEMQNMLVNPKMTGGSKQKGGKNKALVPAPSGPPTGMQNSPMSGDIVAYNTNNNNFQARENAVGDYQPWMKQYGAGKKYMRRGSKKNPKRETKKSKKSGQNGGHHEWIFLLGSLLLAEKKGGKTRKNNKGPKKSKTKSKPKTKSRSRTK